MLQFIIPAVIILAAVIIVTVIIIRHFPQAAAIDVDALPAEKEAAMKAMLMEKRLKRKIYAFKNKLVPLLRKVGAFFKKTEKKMFSKITQMEQKYRKKTQTMTSEEQVDVKNKLRNILDQAKGLVDQENWTEAERKYIEVLSWDQKNTDAYLGLGEVYMEQKEFAQAKDTFQYLLKLVYSQQNGEESNKFSSLMTDVQIKEAHFDFALCLQALGDLHSAKKELESVVIQDPKNPKYLDKLVELSILLKDRVTAHDALSVLRSVNPENQKLSNLEMQIRNI